MNNIKKALVIATLPVVFLLAGCSTQGSSTVDHKAPTAQAEKAAKSDPLLKGFGDVITYDDGISVSVSEPVSYNPSPEAAGEVKGEKVVMFTVVVTNHSKDILDLGGYPDATSGGKQASAVTDLGSKNDVGDTPATKLLPGKSITWHEAFAVANTSDITFQYSPSYDYDTAIFDSSH